MSANGIGFGVSAFFSAFLTVGVFFIGCDRLPFGIGSVPMIVGLLYPFALAFSLIGTAIQFVSVFANRETTLQPRVSRGRAYLLLGGLVLLLCVGRMLFGLYCS
jgi:hypothetical protein